MSFFNNVNDVANIQNTHCSVWLLVDVSRTVANSLQEFDVKVENAPSHPLFLLVFQSD